MTAETLNSANWSVLDLESNPVPGDPEAFATLAGRLLSEACWSQQRGQQLLEVHSANAGRMQGDYVANFEELMLRLPHMSMVLGSSYETCGRALDNFAEALSGIQGRAATALEQGMQADAAYREAAAAVCEMLPGTTITGINEPGPVWRELTAELAAEWAEGYAEEDPDLPAMAGSYGEMAQNAEAERQADISQIQSVVADYMDAVNQCWSLIRQAIPDQSEFTD